ncbi:MAG: helix-turn-helix transcriptional regulator [Lentisphaeria bacterium]|nr:helix-turn-helix transcriptional regulator [Lentisphaeria bacterium]
MLHQNLNELSISVSAVSHSHLNRNWNTKSFQKVFRILPHTRIYFPLSGQGSVSHNKKIYTLQKGKILLIPAFAQVQVNCPDHLEKYWCHFNAYLGESTMDLFYLHQECIELEVEDFDFLTMLFEKLLKLGVQEDPVSLFEFQTGIKLLLARFLPRVTWSSNTEMLGVFTKLLFYINSNLHNDLSLKTLADQVGICRSHLSHIFHEKIGVRLSEYINMHRMYKAMCLLRETSRSISEISDLCGFSSIAVFSKAFKKHTGNSPVGFRKHFSDMPGSF